MVREGDDDGVHREMLAWWSEHKVRDEEEEVSFKDQERGRKFVREELGASGQGFHGLGKKMLEGCQWPRAGG